MRRCRQVGGDGGGEASSTVIRDNLRDKTQELLTECALGAYVRRVWRECRTITRL